MKDYILKINNEAHNWENASPIGAGSIGAMVFGNTASERYCLNEETIWNGDKMDKRSKCKTRNYKTPRGEHRENTLRHKSQQDPL